MLNDKFIQLDWDTEFFGFKVCRIAGELGNNDILNLKSVMNEQGIKLAYYASPNKLEFHKLDDLEIKLVDKKVAFLKETNGLLEKHPSIYSYVEDYPSDKLLDMAVQCGIYSRFNVDEKIGRAKYEEMYKIWMTKSVKKEIAEEMLVYMIDGDIAGYLTVGNKSGVADCGIGAVDPKYRRRGIGKDLFLNADRWAADNGYKHIQCITQAANVAACDLYQKLGYSIESMNYFYHIWNHHV